MLCPHPGPLSQVGMLFPILNLTQNPDYTVRDDGEHQRGLHDGPPAVPGSPQPPRGTREFQE